MGYLIITPVHNEQDNLVRFLDSIISQTYQPDLLLLVDDNSTDDSGEIIKKYSYNYDWIQYVYRKSSEKKVQGSKVIEAFNFGLSKVNICSFDFISKIDADLEFESTFFKCVAKAFNDDPRIGLVGGFIQEFNGTNWITVHDSDYHVRGALKSYKIEAFNDIDGLMPVFGWDGLDEMQLFQKGWRTHNLINKVKHFRPAASDYNSLVLSFNEGKANYLNGGNFPLALIRVLVRLWRRPFLLTAIFFFIGYIYNFALRRPKLVDKDLSKFINYFHYNRIKNGFADCFINSGFYRSEGSS